jgi:hypothetical protein
MEKSGRHHTLAVLSQGKNPIPIEKEAASVAESVWTFYR